MNYTFATYNFANWLRPFIGAAAKSTTVHVLATQLFVTASGQAYLSSDTVNPWDFRSLPGIRIYLQPCLAGEGYVGMQAAQNDNWVQKLYSFLKRNWPRPEGGRLELFK